MIKTFMIEGKAITNKSYNGTTGQGGVLGMYRAPRGWNLHHLP